MEQGLTIQLRGNEFSIESLYMPAYPGRTLRQIEDEEENKIIALLNIILDKYTISHISTLQLGI